MPPKTLPQKANYSPSEFRYYNNRNLSDLQSPNACFGAELLEKILTRIKEKTLQLLHENRQDNRVRILDIGCGTMRLLNSLKNHLARELPVEAVTKIDFYGLDVVCPEAMGKHFHFLQQSAEHAFGENKFDIIISYATFSYIEDLNAALSNTLKALKHNGHAFIGLEAFYLGPHAPVIFSPSAPIQWLNNFGVIHIAKPESNYHGPIFKEHFVKKSVPLYLQWRVFSGKRAGEDTWYFETKDPPLKNCPGKNILFEGINWALFPFLKVQTHNPLPLLSAHPYLPFLKAAPRFYLSAEEAALNPEQLSVYLTDCANWHPVLLDSQDNVRRFSPILKEIFEERQNLLNSFESQFVRGLISKYPAKDPGQRLRKIAYRGNVFDMYLGSRCHQAAINQQDNNPEKRYTALHIACYRENWACATILLRAGANPKLPDAKGTCLLKKLPEEIIEKFTPPKRSVRVPITTSPSASSNKPLLPSYACLFASAAMAATIAVTFAAYQTLSS